MNLAFTKKIALQLVIIAAFVFALYSNVGKVITNNKLNEKLNKQKEDVAAMQTQNSRLKELLVYYQSASYQEIEARRRLNMKKPDETALNIKGLPAGNINGEIIDQIYQESAPAQPATKTNIARWWEYFFKK